MRPRPTAPSRPSRLVTSGTALAHGKISGMGLGGPERLDAVAAKLIARRGSLPAESAGCSNQMWISATMTWSRSPKQIASGRSSDLGGYGHVVRGWPARLGGQRNAGHGWSGLDEFAVPMASSGGDQS